MLDDIEIIIPSFVFFIVTMNKKDRKRALIIITIAHTNCMANKSFHEYMPLKDS